MESAAVRSAIASAEKKLGRRGRLIVRPSGTEPVIRVMGEGDDRSLVESVVDDVVEALSEVAA
jgi:phosphoglucosamine mutase